MYIRIDSIRAFMQAPLLTLGYHSPCLKHQLVVGRAYAPFADGPSWMQAGQAVCGGWPGRSYRVHAMTIIRIELFVCNGTSHSSGLLGGRCFYSLRQSEGWTTACACTGVSRTLAENTWPLGRAMGGLAAFISAPVTLVGRAGKRKMSAYTSSHCPVCTVCDAWRHPMAWVQVFVDGLGTPEQQRNTPA